MLNYVWAFMIIISFLSAIFTGRIQEVSNAVFSGALDSINFLISITGMMAFWTGIMKIADKGGITSAFAKFFYPVMKRLFPSCKENSLAIKSICMNITANLLGLGNAATPMGIKAMKELQKQNPSSHIASKDMIMFVVINTASIQLIPTMMSIIRKNHGALYPLDIMPATWITSFLALVFGILITKFFEKGDNNE